MYLGYIDWIEQALHMALITELDRFTRGPHQCLHVLIVERHFRAQDKPAHDVIRVKENLLWSCQRCKGLVKMFLMMG